LFKQFKSTDKYLVSTPIWNFSIPYRLKHYLDIIVQPGYTFMVTNTGYKGFAGGKLLCVICCRSGSYDEDSAMDFQKKYIELIFGFMDIKTIICQAYTGR
jgi:FMN-dependent NADH-azoreductase